MNDSKIIELENDIKKLKEIIQKYEKIFEIEDGRVFLNSSLGVRGNILGGGQITATYCSSGISSPFYDHVEDLKKMNDEDWKKEHVRQQEELEKRDRKIAEVRKNNGWFK
jgi:hypothetical protein